MHEGGVYSPKSTFGARFGLGMGGEGRGYEQIGAGEGKGSRPHRCVRERGNRARVENAKAG